MATTCASGFATMILGLTPGGRFGLGPRTGKPIGIPIGIEPFGGGAVGVFGVGMGMAVAMDGNLGSEFAVICFASFT